MNSHSTNSFPIFPIFSYWFLVIYQLFCNLWLMVVTMIYDQLIKQGYMKRNLLCKAFCWRFFHKHMAIKTIRMKTITPRTQATMRYNMLLLRTEPFGWPALLPIPRSGKLGGVLRSFTGYSDAPGDRFTNWNESKKGWMKKNGKFMQLLFWPQAELQQQLKML